MWRGAGWVAAFLGIFVFLVVWRQAYLFSPPYWDAATGLWTDAAYLADSNFAYSALELARSKAHSLPANTVIAQTVLATIMRFAPAQAILVWHLMNLATAAVVVLLLVVLLYARIGWAAATLLASIALFTPLFSAQLEQLGSQMPMCALCVASILLLSRGRWVLSAVLVATAMLVDTMAVTLTIGISIYLMTARWQSRARAIGPLLGFASLSCAALLLGWSLTTNIEEISPTRYEIVMGGWVYIARFWTPDVAAMILLACMAGVLLFWPTDSLQRPNVEVYDSARIAWCVLCVSVVWLSFADVMPPDLTLCVVLSIVVLGAAFMRPGQLRLPGWLFAIALLIFHVFNQDGQYYPAPSMLHGPEFSRTGSALSRSLEYRRDHRANIEAVRMIALQRDSVPVIAASPLTHFLALPRLGYVDEPIEGFSLQPVVQATIHMVDFRSTVVSWPANAIYLVTGNPYYCDSPPMVLTGPSDKDAILYRNNEPSPLVVFRRQSSGEAHRDDLSDWVFKRFSVFATVYHRAMARAVIDEHRGQIDRAVSELEKELTFSPVNAELHIALTGLLLKEGHEDRAVTELMAVLQRNSNHVEANLQLGILRLKQNRIDEAVPLLEKALELGPDRADVHFFVAAAFARQGRIELAIKHLVISLAIDPENDGCHFNLGLLYSKQGNREAAIEHFRETLRLHPDFPAARQQLEKLGVSR